jgi:hypothetical protein
MAKSLFIVELENLRISENLGRGDRIGSVLVTNDIQMKEELISPAFKHSFGSLEAGSLLEPGIVVAYRIQDDVDPLDADSSLHEVELRLSQLQALSFSIWLTRDCAVSTEIAFWLAPFRRHGASAEGLRSTRNFMAIKETDSRGERPLLELNREELRHVRTLFSQIVPDEGDLLSPELARSTASRWARATYFIQAARSIGDPILKVANYVTALEALFASDHAELAHRLSERVAVFLSDEYLERTSIYSTIKRAYSIRSKGVHGAPVRQKDNEQARESCVALDRFLRAAMNKILSNPASSSVFISEIKPEDFDNYFLGLLFDAPIAGSTQ